MAGRSEGSISLDVVVAFEQELDRDGLRCRHSLECTWLNSLDQLFLVVIPSSPRSERQGQTPCRR